MSTICDSRPATIPKSVGRFFDCLFQPQDLVLTRPTETWNEGKKKCSRVIYKQVRHYQAGEMATNAALWQTMQSMLQEERANAFFGVCPRFGTGGKYDCAFQIRTVRVLWSDIDHCSVEEAVSRCEKAGLPRPTAIVKSGNGVHLYWLLGEPVLIDDAGDPPAILTEWPPRIEGQKNRPRHYIELPDGKRLYKYFVDPKTGADTQKQNPEWPKLSPKAEHVQEVIGGIASRIGGDHTHDLARILRIPGTLNRKDERNGKVPVPCELIECDPSRVYPFADFEALAECSPEKARKTEAAKIRLPKRKLSTGRLNKLNDFINRCALAEPGVDDRSGCDWALVCYAIREGLDQEAVWAQVAEVGKFGERGRPYFDLTWNEANKQVRFNIYDRLKRKAARKAAHSNGQPSGNGQSNGVPPHSDHDEGPPEEEVKEELEDPHRLARKYLAKTAAHQEGYLLRYCREKFHRYVGTHWKAIPDADLRAELTHFVKEQLNEDFAEQESSQEQYVPKVTKELVSNVMQAITGEVYLPHDTFVGAWINGKQSEKRNYIAVLNGLLDVDAYLRKEDEVLRPHSPRWFSPVCLPYEYDPRADCSLWRGFLNRNLADDLGKIGLLRHWFGYLLLPDTSFQKFLMMVGEGANGKSVVCGVTEGLLGEQNISAVPLELFGQKFQLAPTEGKLANVIAEVGELDKIAEGQIKAFVTGDPISFEEKFKTPYRAKPTARLMLATNNPPQFSDKSDGIWRRVLLLSFTVQIPEHEQVAGMDKPNWWREHGELPGILNWSLAGLAELRAQGRFIVPEVSKRDLAKLRSDVNPTRRYLLEHYESPPSADAIERDLNCREVYGHYKAWCLEHGCHAFGDGGFGKEVARIFKKVERVRSKHAVMLSGMDHPSRPWLYFGLGRKDLAAPDEDAQPDLS